MKQDEPSKYVKAIKTVQDLDFKEQEGVYKAKSKQMPLSFVRIHQSLGWGEYLVVGAAGNTTGITYHLTLQNDRLDKGGVADGETIAVSAELGGLYKYTDVNGVERSVRMIRELAKPPKPQRRAYLELEKLLQGGKHYMWETSVKVADGSRVRKSYRLEWGKVTAPKLRSPGSSVEVLTNGSFRIQEYEWANGEDSIKLLPAQNGVAFLSSVCGKFLGGGEGLEVSLGADQYWHFTGKSMQRIRAKVMTVEPKNESPFGSVRSVVIKSGEPAVRLIEGKEGFAFLSATSGQFLAGGAYVRVWLDPDGWWYLKGNGPVTGKATVVEWRDGLTPPEVITYSWVKGNEPIRMIPQNEGFCFLSMMAGGFNGGGEHLQIFIDEDEFWKFRGSTKRSMTRGEAVALRFSENTKAPRSELFSSENRDHWTIGGGTWEFHSDQLIGSGKGGITLNLERKPPLTVEFVIDVIQGKRPRVKLAGTTLANEGYKRTLALYPRKGVERITEKGNGYSLATPMKILLKVREDGIDYYRDGELWERRDYKIDSIPSIRFSCGDGWSAGTISIRGLSVN
ncbi:MAG: hypothetical protein ACSHX9_14950 [Luteolibacter sp.]